MNRLMELQRLIVTIANLTKDGEEIDGVEWDMPNDDAVDTLHSVIDAARGLIGAPGED